MLSFWFPLLLSVVVELTLIDHLPIAGVKPPLTLICLLLLRYKQWLSWPSALLLAGLNGYILDVNAAPKPTNILFGYLLALGLSELIWWRLKAGDTRRKLVPLIALLLYYLVLSSSFELRLSWQNASQSGLFVAVSGISLWFLNALMRRIGRWL